VTKNNPQFRILRDYTRSTLFKKSQFDFSLYFKTLSQTIKITDVKFLQWFGFSEGDGSFIISKTYCSFILLTL
jgi:hypothetical protein